MAAKQTEQSKRRRIPVLPLTANELFFDAMIRHQIGTLRFGGGVRNRILRLLDATESDIRDTIRRSMRRSVGFKTPGQLSRLKRLLKEIGELRSAAWQDARVLWRSELLDLVRIEPGFVDGLLKTVVPVQLRTGLPDADRLTAIVTSQPFEGSPLSEWAKRIRRADIERISDQIRIGLTMGETGPEISRRIVGTVRLRGRNGVTELTRNGASSIVLTSVNAVANHARQAYFEENSHLISVELFVATLDARTTPICRSLDGKRFPLGEGPIPPLHFRCRSLRTALLDDEPIGKRPSKPVHERRLLREFIEQEDIDFMGTPLNRGQLPRGSRRRFDEFARKRTRELIGRVPSKVTYQKWLERQPASFQDDVLGKTRARLFRRGGLKLDKFVDMAGKEKTLAQLALDERRAFLAAGLDPGEFLR